MLEYKRRLQSMPMTDEETGQMHSGRMNQISIFCYVDEDNCYVAHALEMDMAGGGASWKAAMDELASRISSHLSLAEEKGLLSAVWNHRAPDEYFRRFREASSFLCKSEAGKSNFTIEARIADEALVTTSSAGSKISPEVMTFMFSPVSASTAKHRETANWDVENPIVALMASLDRYPASSMQVGQTGA